MKDLWLCREKRDLCIAFHGTFTTVERRVLSIEAFIHVRRVLLIAATTKYDGVVCVFCSTVLAQKNLHQVVCVNFAF
jgi:hypothetical protein